MTLTSQHLIAMLPMMIIGFAVVAVMLGIAFKRCHKMAFSLTVIGLVAAFISLCTVAQNGIMPVTQLMVVDQYGMFYTGLVLIASLAVTILAYPWLQEYPDNKEEFYLLILLATLGGLLLANANHLAALFLGIELLSLPLFGLVGYAYRQSRSLEAAIKYMLLSAAASAFLLFGMALLYAGSGSLSFIALGKALELGTEHSGLLYAGLGMMVVGLGFKLSFAPFQLWTPDVYQGAPAPVSMYLATGSKIAILAAMVRLFIYAPVAQSEGLHLVLSVIAVFSILFGNFLAISQHNVKRLLAYSSVAHMGYLLIAIIALPKTELAVSTVGVYLVGYLLSSIGAFGVISLMSGYDAKHGDDLADLKGLYWHKPVLAIVMTIMLLSLAGIPMTFGFIGKFAVIAAAVQAGEFWLTALVVIGSAMGLYYYLRAVVQLFARNNRNVYVGKGRQIPCAALTLLVIATLLVIILGVYPQVLMSITDIALPMH